jgi:predicted Zn-dependent peptidase
MKSLHLKNGIPTFILPTCGTDAVTVLVLFKVGSRYEHEEIRGASHFIEHMMFKGTEKRPKAEMISKELDGVGAEYNAYTGKDGTGYWVKVAKKHAELAVSLLHDMLTCSLFRASDMNRERKVIIEEINMYHDNPMMHIEELLEEEAFKGSTLGCEIAGSKKHMEKMHRKDVLDFLNSHYSPERMVIAVAGAVGADFKSRLERTFGRMAKHKRVSRGFENFSPESFAKHPRASVQYKDTQQVQIALGFPSCGYSDDRLAATRLLSVILGGSMSSRLFSAVREKRGLCYFVRTQINTYEDTGLFVVRSGLDKSRLPLAGKVIMNELRAIAKTKVSSDELRKAVDYISGKTVLELEDSAARAEWFATQQLYLERALTPEEKLAQYKNVTSSQIREVAEIIFDTKKMCVAGIGPFKNSQEVLKYFV